MLLSAVSVLVVAQSSSEIPEGLMNNPVYATHSDPESLPVRRTPSNLCWFFPSRRHNPQNKNSAYFSAEH